MIKLLMSWDIKVGKEAEYMEFVTREFTPKLMKIGIQPTEAWYTVVGNGPQVLAGGITKDREAMMSILESEEWQTTCATTSTRWCLPPVSFNSSRPIVLGSCPWY